MDFDKIGEMALGSRLKALSDVITNDAQQIYDLYGETFRPKWFPVFYYLSNQTQGRAITTIAQAINQSHPSVIKVVREMLAGGLIVEEKDPSDGRVNNISLTAKGVRMTLQINVTSVDVGAAVTTTLEQTKHNLWLAMQEFEYLLKEKSLYRRVLEQKKRRESARVEFVDYTPAHQKAFKALNEEWITKYFRIEEADSKALDDPQGYILDDGGHIVIALLEEEVVGVCALIRMDNPNYDFELAKMAVTPKVRGKGIGHLLGVAVIEKAKALGASTLYLESNTKLVPAISLYEKLGFQKVAGHYTPYERCNIQMELELKE